MKYIRHDVLGVIMWPAKSGTLPHAEVADILFGNRCGEVISAGFVMTMPDGELKCFGSSASLNIGGLPDDTEVLKGQLCGR